jgi:Thioredoxin like C-terminal domain
VHTPEFPFERDLANVRRAVQDRQLSHPVAVDSDYAIWTAFANMYWPALYVVDAQGHIRYHHFGEGAYAESEQVIRQLLAEAGTGDTLPEPVSVEARGIEAAADWADLASAENYLGAERTENFASPELAATGTPRRYTTPSQLAPDHWALSGEWTVQPDAVLLDEPGGTIADRFTARDLHLVMAPAAAGVPVRFTVHLDGQPPGPHHGDDVDEDGTGTVTAPRLYQLLRQRGPVAERTFEITFADPGVQAYAFTFG